MRSTACPLLDSAGKVQRLGGIFEDATETRLAIENQKVLLAELQHRVRNMLAVVRSVFGRSADTADDLAALTEHFYGRLDALARTQVIVTRNADELTDLEELIREELLVVGMTDGPRLEIGGESVSLPAKLAELIGLAIHELTTNALKYGALSQPAGRLSIVWRINMDERGARNLDLCWTESGVPAVPLTPARTGFGRELIEQALPYQLRGQTRLEFRGGGVRCSIIAPLPD